MAADERGSGPIGSLIGVTVVLVFLLFAAHVLAQLATRSMVQAVAFDAARIVSGAAGAGQVAAAQGQAEALLGRLGEHTTFEWLALGPDVVALRVAADAPVMLPDRFAAAMGLDRIEHTVRVRVEDFR